METIKVVLSLLGMLGIPTTFAIAGYIINNFKKYNKKINILMKAVQAQMRSNLLKEYYLAKERGYISPDDLDDWENQYQSYHALGKNGVLDRRRDELFSMPSKLED